MEISTTQWQTNKTYTAYARIVDSLTKTAQKNWDKTESNWNKSSEYFNFIYLDLAVVSLLFHNKLLPSHIPFVASWGKLNKFRSSIGIVKQQNTKSMYLCSIIFQS